MTKKLKIRFVKFECALAAQQLEIQWGTAPFESFEHTMFEAFHIDFAYDAVWLGRHPNRNVAVRIFDSNAARDKYLNNVIKWISEEQFATGGKLEIGKECEASDNGENWFVRFFAGKSAKQLGEPRYLAYWYDNLGYLIRYKYVRPLASFVRPKIDGDVYTWEMEVSDER